MPRNPRVAGEFLHVIVRGIGKQILFEDSSDKEKFLFFLKKYSTESNISIFAYCLMENHVHLLVRDLQGTNSFFMKKVGVCYAQYFNGKYDRTGHLFQDRFKSEIISDNAQLLSVYRYILQNPQKAGFCNAELYPWSSYHEYGKHNALTDTSMLQSLIGDKSAFQRFIRRSDDSEHMDVEIRKKNDEWALATIKETLNVTSGTQLQNLSRIKRNEAIALLKNKGLSVRQIERLTGISRGVVQAVS